MMSEVGLARQACRDFSRGLRNLPEHRAEHWGRFVKRPDDRDLERVRAAAERWNCLQTTFAPEGEIRLAMRRTARTARVTAAIVSCSTTGGSSA